eukprot:1143192-Pelagomonas_calceolata.AAC.3
MKGSSKALTGSFEASGTCEEGSHMKGFFKALMRLCPGKLSLHESMNTSCLKRAFHSGSEHLLRSPIKDSIEIAHRLPACKHLYIPSPQHMHKQQ